MRSRSGRRRFLSYQRQALLFLAPYIVGTAVLVLLPALFTIFLAFTEYGGLAAPVWVGWAKFEQLVASPLVRLTLRNTGIFWAIAVPLRLLGALLAALLLQRRRRLFGLYRAAVYLPTVIPEAAYALIWLWLLNPVHGPLNMILAGLGLPAPAWLAEAGTARLAMGIMAAFQIGEGMVVLLAGLQSIPRSLYEAAAVDGANAWKSFWRITLPLITPWLLLLTFRDLVVSMQNTFAPSFMMTYGGPYYGTTFVPLLVYELSFDYGDIALASAVLVVTYLLIAGLVIGIRNLVEGLRGSSDEV